MDILSTLNLDGVTANPDDVPVGSYDAVIFKSEYVLSKNKDSIAHVITFKVEGGDHAGAKPSQWNTLGSTPRDAEGNFPANVVDVVTYTPTMSDQQKSYYKKTWVDCGVPPEQVGRLQPEALVGKKVTIRVYEKNGFRNVAVNGVRADAGDSSDGPSPFAGGVPSF